MVAVVLVGEEGALTLLSQYNGDNGGGGDDDDDTAEDIIIVCDDSGGFGMALEEEEEGEWGWREAAPSPKRLAQNVVLRC